MVDAGIDSPLGELLPLVRSMVNGIDVGELEVPEAVRVVEECAEAERLFAALRVVVAATLENKAVWRREGFRSLAAWMASKTGTAVAPAIASLEMAGSALRAARGGGGISRRPAVRDPGAEDRGGSVRGA